MPLRQGLSDGPKIARQPNLEAATDGTFVWFPEKTIALV